MNTPDAETLLRVWEEHGGAHPIRRALALLEAAWPEVGAAGWAQATLGERDGCLIALYEALFGTQLQTVTQCPHCGERLESSFQTRDIRVRQPVLPASPAWQRLSEQGYDIEYRLPNSEDLLHLTAMQSGAAAALLQRCVGAATRGGAPVDAAALPPAVVEKLSTEMARQDPDADVRIGLSCAACRKTWSVVFDIIAYFWSELEDWAQRTLADVHLLARAYGWGEREILALSPTRRRLYLDMVRA